MKHLPIGINNYKEIIEENCYYVDKTLLIKELLSKRDKATLLCRPRRFGKTLTLSMLKYFFEKTEISNAHLFTDKKVWEHEDVRTHQGQYPVIFISFKDVKDANFEDAYKSIVLIILKEFERYEKVLLSNLNEGQALRYNMLKSGAADNILLCSSLLFLSELLHEHYGKRVIVLLDEYDTPIHAAYTHSYYAEMIIFIKKLFSSVLKDNDHLERSVLTGILRTAKEGIFSDLNNLAVYTLLNDEFSDKFGFTSDEVDLLLKDQNLTEHKVAIQKWYNGYHAGETSLIYNPWSILNCVNKNGKFMTYWVNTSSNDLIKTLIAGANSYVKQELESLLNDIPVVKTIEEAFTFATVYQTDNVLWSLLLFSGYVTYSERILTNKGKYDCNLTLPNHEIRCLYKDFISEIFISSFKDQDNIKEFFRALTNKDTRSVQQLLQLFITNSMSFYDLAHNEPEKSYHLFILGLLVTLENTYSVRSNRESGYGRYDIMLIPHDKSQVGIVIEFKKVGDQTLEEASEAALLQIQDKKYANELYAQGITNIIGYGIAFAGKQVLVKSLVLYNRD